MTGLKSGSGDDLWGESSEDSDDATESDMNTESETEASTTANHSAPTTANDRRERSSEASAPNSDSADGGSSTVSASATSDESTHQQQPYIVRRAVQDKSVQFERDERLTFFVHDDVVDGERDLITDVESELGRSVPKFDVREAVYRAALRNRDDVLEELLEMGYSTDDP